ncbi:lipase 5 [Colletotrichum asianum]|uniref:Carboxylic ester hydrolase n=1 Tax=Colletotrichum asianum TaxID=702518 RepID=A0A8H3W3Y4_9PEZI|nr:lipase 5 [Colletotrichum asianum]
MLHGYVWPNGVRQFYGIPYGSFVKNWTRSTLVDSWPNGEHDGRKLGPWAVQPVPWDFVSYHSSYPVHPYSYLNKPDENNNRDSLTINLTVPPDVEVGNVPVLAFIHGGAFIFGSSYFLIYDGYRLVSEAIRKGKPVVFASFNYRLGLFGFLASKDIREDLQRDGFEGNGNFGLTDQQLALEWIQKHINHFGGDRNNVTILGESAGGMSVGAQIHSRRGPELFSRGAQLSGNMCSVLLFTEKQHEQLYIRVLKLLDISPEAPDRLHRLQAVPDEKIREVTQDSFTTLISIASLCEDGWFWAESRDDRVQNPPAPPPWLKGLITSDVRDESGVFRDELSTNTLDKLEERLQKRLVPDAIAGVKKLYNIHEDVTWAQREEILEAIKSSVPHFVYHFDQPCYFSDNIFRREAYHAFDLLFIFLTRYEQFNPEERLLAEDVHTSFINFAHGIDPWERHQLRHRSRVWGPDGKIQLLDEGEDVTRKYSRMRELVSKKWYDDGFFQVAEDIVVGRYRIFEQ